jgi:hypothetical protein
MAVDPPFSLGRRLRFGLSRPRLRTCLTCGQPHPAGCDHSHSAICRWVIANMVHSRPSQQRRQAASAYRSAPHVDHGGLRGCCHPIECILGLPLPNPIGHHISCLYRPGELRRDHWRTTETVSSLGGSRVLAPHNDRVSVVYSGRRSVERRREGHAAAGERVTDKPALSVSSATRTGQAGASYLKSRFSTTRRTKGPLETQGLCWKSEHRLVLHDLVCRTQAVQDGGERHQLLPK